MALISSVSRGGGWLTRQNDNGTIEEKIASVIVLFLFLISGLNDPKEGGGWLATQSTPPGSVPVMQ